MRSPWMWLSLDSVFIIAQITSIWCYEVRLVKSVSDEVGPENYSYYEWAARDDFPMLIKLISTSGDADLYVSDKVRRPTFDDYSIKSTTCGEDTVDITDLKRPIYIGVFGSHAFETSSYALQFYRIIDENYSPDDPPSIKYRDMESAGSSRAQSADPTDTHSLASILWEILEFLLKIVVEILL